MTDKVDRNPRIVVLCEDARHGKCVRAFLRERGIHKGAIRVRTCPAATQDAKQWIRETSLPEEWAFLDKYNRKNPKSRRLLLVVSDADNKTVDEHRENLSENCETNVSQSPHVAFFIPRWAIETWVLHLLGSTIDEGTRITPSHKTSCRNREREAAKALAKQCDRTGPPTPPPSLAAACRELDRVKNFL